MTADRDSISIRALRAGARRLLRTLRAGGPAALAAAERFRVLDEFRAATAADLAARPERVRLRHALTVVAMQRGAPSWVALKEQVQRALPMYDPGMAALLNQWYAAYAPARAALVAGGGYLFPYRNQFLICEAEGVRLLGLDPRDEDWARIEFDWVQPADRHAWGRLAEKREAVLAQERTRTPAPPY